MNKPNLLGLIVVTACFAACCSAGAQSVHHDRMDARAAHADYMHLKADRRIARMHHNWGKVKEDNRLMAVDRKFMRKDRRKVMRAGY
jgi:hypothetical protein